MKKNDKSFKFFVKNLCLVFSIIIVTFGLMACNDSSKTGDENPVSNNKTEETSESTDSQTSKPKVTVTTSFLYDMVKVLAPDMTEVQMIIPAGSDPHLYVAKPTDYDKIEGSDLLLYHGLHFEGKMVDALEEKGVSVTANFPEDKLLQMDEDGNKITDPHFWFDIDLYKLATQNAADALVKLLPDNKDKIEENTKNYLAQLDSLKEKGIEMISSIPKENRFLITPHDAFNYFSRTFDIEVMAPQGVSTDSEVSNKDLGNTADFIVEHKIKSIFAESTTDPARMKKLQESCKAKGFDVNVVSGEGKELFSDSLAPEGQAGDTFLTMVEHNLNLIYENLK